ncbi:uncharacterized protein TNCV_2976551 [Trichonephila clavipes]|nr:uncharacterized protein TNCV_2976551 [Trichonephila clavipes]
MKIRVRYRSRQNYSLRGMSAQVHIDITPLHTSLPVFRRIGEHKIPYLWRTYKQLCHLCETALRSNGLFVSMFDGLVAFAVDRWCHDCGAQRIRFRSRSWSPMKEGSFWVPSVPNENASTLPITPKRTSSRDVGTRSYIYHTYAT